MVAHELTETAGRRGIKTIINGSRSAQDQVRAVETMIREGVDGIVLSPILSQMPELLPLLDAAKAKGISVVLVGIELQGAESLPLVRSDSATGQAEVAEHVFRHLDGKGKVAYIQARQSSVNIVRVRAFHNVLARYPGIQLVKDIVRDSAPLQVTGTVSEMGRVWGREIITEHPDIRAILVAQDNIALGVLDFLEREGVSRSIIVTGFDGIPAGLKAIQQGRLFASVGLPAVEIARTALHMILTLLDGGTVSHRTFLPTRLITRDNIADAALSALSFLPGMIELQQELLTTMRSERERFQSLVELSSDWYWEQDEEFRFRDNGESGNMFVAGEGRRLWEVPGVEAPEEHWRKHRDALAAHAPFHDFEFQHTDVTGSIRYITVSGRPIFDKEGAFRGYRGVAKDITERRRSEDQIMALAYYDALTSLPNRRLFGEHVDRGLAQARRHGRRLAVMFIDLDRFKDINDALGHEAGDRLLCEISRRLRHCLRQGDTVCRFGGDEFVVLLEDLNHAHSAIAVADKILAAVARPVPLGDVERSVTASIGISVFPEDGGDQYTLMKNADYAMYTAKAQGKNRFTFYSAQPNRRSNPRALKSDPA
jgi:diguanylate cyclase (GGDEF)-like protein/PAS domain S-box-containing protein